MAGMKIAAVVVVYNKEVKNSRTFSTINKRKDIDLLVVDNSTIINSNEQYCMENGVSYISMGSNQGLSKAYNVAIEYLKPYAEVVILLDDDTIVPNEYFEELIIALKEEKKLCDT